ncbi:MAG: hypothetical protein KDA61_20230 [Planctomycetales bacterium]|nr:hypothetical protein [Planctomycetales bacterium]
MVHFAFVFDANPSSRRQFVVETERRLHDCSELTVHSAELGDMSLVWAVGQRTPTSLLQTADQLTLLIGYAIDDDGTWLTAAQLSERYSLACGRPFVADGYYAAIRSDAQGRFSVGVDPWGMFPCYWRADGNVLLAGSSAEALGSHPGCKLTVDLLGLSGILLSNGLVAHRSLFENVARLQTGCNLERFGGSVAERRVFALVRDDRQRDLSGEELSRVVDHEFQRAVARHAPSDDASLLLSGGMDSRLMAGYLHALDFRPRAICFGRPYDFECRAALRVSEALDLSIELDSHEIAADEAGEQAIRLARWQHLSGGFGEFEKWTATRADALPARFFCSGYFVDDLLGGLSLRTGYEAAAGDWSFATFRSRTGRWALSVEEMEALLLHGDKREMTAAVLDAWKSDYEREDWEPHQCCFAGKLASRPRYHIGSHLHRMSSVSWPLTPTLDRRFVQTLFNLDPHPFLYRSLELELLTQKFPKLAQIPFDTNSFQFVPSYVKQSRRRFSRQQSAVHWVEKNVRRFYWKQWRRQEPRRYHRLFDMNSTAWRAVRRRAELGREMLHQFFSPSHLKTLAPGPDTTLPMRDPFANAAPLRTLLGAMLWFEGDPSASERHLSALSA